MCQVEEDDEWLAVKKKITWIYQWAKNEMKMYVYYVLKGSARDAELFWGHSRIVKNFKKDKTDFKKYLMEQKVHEGFKLCNK